MANDQQKLLKKDGPAFTGSVSGSINARADAVFAHVIDIGRLPEWNRVVRRVLERPETLGVGTEWVVQIAPPGWPRWRSRSRVLELDRPHRVFRHMTNTDDGNPSWMEWRWDVEEEPGGSRITVSWEGHPKTFWRRALFSRLRNRRLRRLEVPKSIDALRALATSTPATTSSTEAN